VPYKDAEIYPFITGTALPSISSHCFLDGLGWLTERFQTSATQGFLRLPIAQRLRSDTLQRLSASAQATVMGWQRSSFVTELARPV